jgi:hypothetical protein
MRMKLFNALTGTNVEILHSVQNDTTSFSMTLLGFRMTPRRSGWHQCVQHDIL